MAIKSCDPMQKKHRSGGQAMPEFHWSLCRIAYLLHTKSLGARCVSALPGAEKRRQIAVNTLSEHYGDILGKGQSKGQV